MFSHLDAAFKYFGKDQGALLEMLALERAGARHFCEIPVGAGGCQEANAAFLTLLHGKQANNAQHLVLLQKGLSLGVLYAVSLEPTNSHEVNTGRKHIGGISSGAHYPCSPQVQKERKKSTDTSAESAELFLLIGYI